MRRFYLFFLLSLIFTNICSCAKLYVLKPEYHSLEEIRLSIKVIKAQPILQAGKHYQFRNYLFVNEKEKGIHIIDIKDESNPKSTQFIHIPGNYHFILKGSFLYADSYRDLVIFELKNNRWKKVGYIKNVYQHRVPQSKWIHQWLRKCRDCSFVYEKVNSARGIVKGWKVVEEHARSGKSRRRYHGPLQAYINLLDRPNFVVYENFLYIPYQSSILIFDIKDPHHPEFIKSIHFEKTKISGLLVYRNYLFINFWYKELGLYQLKEPLNPKQISAVKFSIKRPIVYQNKIYTFSRKFTLKEHVIKNDKLHEINKFGFSKPERRWRRGYYYDPIYSIVMKDDLFFMTFEMYNFQIFKNKKQIFRLYDSPVWPKFLKSDEKTYKIIVTGSYIYLFNPRGFAVLKINDGKNISFIRFIGKGKEEAK